MQIQLNLIDQEAYMIIYGLSALDKNAQDLMANINNQIATQLNATPAT